MINKPFNWIKNLTTLLIIGSFIIAPIDVLAQQDPDFEGPAYENPDYFGENGEENYPEAQQALQERAQKDAEAAKADAQKTQQDEQADQQKCESQQGQTGSKMQQALNQAFSDTIKKVFTEDLPKTLEGGLNTALRTAISDSLGGNSNNNSSSGNGIDFKNEFSTQLVNQARQQFNTDFRNAIQRESVNGTQPISSDRLKQIAQDQLRQSFQKSYKSALKQSFSTTLGGDEINGRPGLLRTLSQNQLPTIIEQTLNQKGPGAFSSTSDSTFKTILGTDTFNLTADAIQSVLPDGSIGIGSLGTQANSTLIAKVAEFILSKIIENANNQSQQNIASIIPLINDRLNSSDGLNSSLNNIPFGSIVKKMGGQMNGSIDFALTRTGSNNKTFDANINAQMDTIINQVFAGSNLNQNFGQIADSINNNGFNPGNNILNNSINGLFQTVAGNGSASLGTVITGSISGEVNGLMQTALGSVTSQGGFAGQLVGQLSAPLSQMTNQLMAPVLDPINGAINQITGGLSGALGGLPINLTGIFTDPIGTITNGVVSIATNAITGGIASAVTKGLAGNVVGGVAGSGVSGALGLGPFVPTTEQLGILTIGITGIQTNTSAISATTKSTDATVKDTNKLTVEICTKEKSMQRIAAEEAKMRNVTNPQLRRDAASIIENWRNKVSSFTQSGYKKVQNGQITDNPLFVTNQNQYYTDVRTEAKAIFMDTLRNSGNIFKQQVANSIRQDDTSSQLKSSITQDEYNQFKNGQIKNPDDWWRIYRAISNPFLPNSPESAERISRNLLAAAETKAIEQAKTDIQASQGYLPVRTCKQMTSDGQACAEWVNTTPAIQVKETVAQAFAFRPEKYTDPEPGDVAPGNEPSLNELRLFKPSTSGGGAQGPNINDTKNVLSLITGLLERLRDFRNTQNSASTTADVAFDYSIPPIDATESGQAPSVMTISWRGQKITSCSAGNDWLGSLAIPGTITSIRTKDQDLGTSGQVTIPIPLDFSIRYVRTRNGIDGSYNVGSVNLSNITTVKTIGMPDADTLTPGDFLSIRFFPYYSFNGIVATITPANLNNPLPDLIAAVQKAYTDTNNPLRYPEISKFTPTYSSDSISFIPNLVYQINCVAENGGTITKSINMTSPLSYP